MVARPAVAVWRRVGCAQPGPRSPGHRPVGCIWRWSRSTGPGSGHVACCPRRGT